MSRRLIPSPKISYELVFAITITTIACTPDLLDSIKVRHISCGVSAIGLKSYQRERESFQGETLDYLWFDEEPPADMKQLGIKLGGGD